MPRSASKYCSYLTGWSSAQLKRVPFGASDPADTMSSVWVQSASTQGAEVRDSGKSTQARPFLRAEQTEFFTEALECAAQGSVSKCVGPSPHTGRAGSGFGFSELCEGSTIHVRESRKYAHSPQPTLAQTFFL